MGQPENVLLVLTWRRHGGVGLGGEVGKADLVGTKAIADAGVYRFALVRGVDIRNATN